MTLTPSLQWEVATGYDLIASLDVLHDPDRYGLRGSWAAGVRSRLPADQRDLLQKMIKHNNMLMIPWLAQIDGPKDSQSVLKRVAEIPPADRLPTFLRSTSWGEAKGLLLEVAEQSHYSDADVEKLQKIRQAHYREHGIKKKINKSELENTLMIWSQAETFGEGILPALQTYYDVFFSEEEKRILPALERTAIDAKELANSLSFEALLNELSQGVRFVEEELDNIEKVMMIPLFWTTPLSLLAQLDPEADSWFFIFGGRPGTVSLVPGETVPELLHQTLKALADPTRLRILRYLAKEPLTPAELARRLRLRPPTVIHHLDVLRLARLVHVTLTQNGRRYEARREAIRTTMQMLDHFLDG